MKINRYCLGIALGFLLLSESVALAVVKTAPQMSPAITQNLIGKAIFITDYEFSDREWQVKIKQRGSDLQYDGFNIGTGKGIKITGVKRSGTASRKIYTWRNKRTVYTVIWRPSDPYYARLQVTDNGSLVINQLLQDTREQP